MNYNKQKLALRYYLLGAKMYDVLEAFNLAESIHEGVRRDNSPEFSHQIRITSSLRLYGVDNKTLIVALLHDVFEDYNVGNTGGVITKKINSHLFLLNKNNYESSKENYDAILNKWRSVMVKAEDRIDNLQSMISGMTKEKQAIYIAETQQYVLPMLKNARRKYPKYENIFQLQYNTILRLLHVYTQTPINESLENSNSQG